MLPFPKPFRLPVVLAAALTAFPAIRLAHGQQPQYERLPVLQALVGDTAEAKNARRNAELFVANAKRNSGSLEDANNKRKFDIYYKQYFFPRLTHEENLPEWAEARSRLLKELTSPAPAMPVDVHNYFVEMIRQVTTVIAKGNYHPAARVNAILLLGGLNSREAVLLGDPKRPPEPLIAALAFMLGEFENEQNPSGIRAACLVGMLRHVKLDRLLPNANRRLVGNTAESRIIAAMIKLLRQDQPPGDNSQAGHDWMRRRAAQILGWLGSTGGGDVPRELERIVDDAQMDVALRCDAAEALGRLNYGQTGVAAPSELAKKMGGVAVFACYQELQRVEEQQRIEEEREAASSPYGYGGYEDSYDSDYGESYEEEYGYGYGGIPGAERKPFDPLGYRVHLTRRRIKSQLTSVRQGLIGPQREQEGGLLAAAGEPADQEYVRKVVAGIDGIATVIDEASQADMETLIESVRTAVQDMEDSCEIAVAIGEETLDEDFLADPMETGDDLGPPLDAGEAGPPLGEVPPAGPPIPPGPKPPAGEPKTPPGAETTPPGKTPPGPPAAGKTAPAAPAPGKTPPKPPTPPAKTGPAKTPPAKSGPAKTPPAAPAGPAGN